MTGDQAEAVPGQLMEPSESATRELTLEEAVSLAILLQQNKQFVEAGEVYRRVLETVPDHPRALHYAGVLAHQQGRNDEALALIERSIALVPDQADWCSNLGIVFQSDNRLNSAIDPNHANAHNNLGVLLRVTGQPVEAEAAYRAAIRLDPEHIDAYTNLGILLNGLKRTEEAAACYCKVITLRPKHREARKLLALAHCTLGEIGKAANIFQEWLDEEPGIRSRGTCWRPARVEMCPNARQMLSSRQPSTVLRRASKRSSRRYHIVRQRSSRQCWRIRALSYRISTCWTQGVEQDSAARSSRLLRGGWSAWICQK